MPGNIDEKDDLLDSLEEDDDKVSTRERLVELAEKQEEENYNLTAALALWIRSHS